MRSGGSLESVLTAVAGVEVPDAAIDVDGEFPIAGDHATASRVRAPMAPRPAGSSAVLGATAT
jgi:hypothetical protein